VKTLSSAYGLIVVSAPSGAGKSTLCTRLLKDCSHRLSLSVSTTSRSPRGQEQNGREYFFVEADHFLTEINRGRFAEWALVHGNYYGTSRDTLEQFWSNRHHVLLDIDVQGAESLRKQYPNQMLSVFIAPPSLEVLEQRLRGRGTDSDATIQKRMNNAVMELGRQSEFDQVVVNDDFDTAYLQLKTICDDFMNRLEEGRWQKRA
jgi:guanylate kinase